MKRSPLAIIWSFFILAVLAGQVRGESFTISSIVGSPGILGSEDGTNANARLEGPAALGRDQAGNVYLSDGNALRQLTQFGTNWVVQTLGGVAGSHGFVDGFGTNALFDGPEGIVIDAATNIYVADANNHALRKLAPTGTTWVASTLAGAGRFNPGSSDGTNAAARFNHPYGIAQDPAGNLYVADTYNQTIRLATPQGTNWIVTTIAGLAGAAGSVDASNATARFNYPAAIARDPVSGNFYVADFNNQTIRSLTASGTNWVVTTIAGLANSPGSADGTNSAARFNSPASIAIDNSGVLYVADSANNTLRSLRRFGTNWVVRTIAGSAGTIGATDGTGPAALFNQPSGIVADPAGPIYVADSVNYTVRKGSVAAVLQANLLPGQIGISWPTGVAGFHLASKPSLSGGWQILTNGVVTVGDTVTFSTNLSRGSAVYRLQKP